MPLTFDQTLKLLSPVNPDATSAFIYSGLNALVFLELPDYDVALGHALGADLVARYGGTGPFVPHVLQLSGPGGAIFAFEGTRNYQQWISFVTGAGVVNWQGIYGDVFAPFATITNPILADVRNAAVAQGRVWLTGHSLGAASCALMIPVIVHEDVKVVSGIFACPRCVGQRFVNLMGQRPYLVNHPFDPVPVIVPDCVTDLRRDPLALQFRGPIQAPGDPFWLAAHAAQMRGRSQLDWLAGIGAGLVGGVDGIHQTFRYIRDTYQEVPDFLVGPNAPLEDFADLLKALGLFDPWP